MTTVDLKQKIWDHNKSLAGVEGHHWQNISFSLTAIDFSVNEFLGNKNPEIAICHAKTIIMELWNIREFLTALKKSTSNFDSKFINLKELRDSYAHIKERVEGFKKPFNSAKTPLYWENRTIANGAMISKDGTNWSMSADQKIGRLFNFNFSGPNGAMSIFGIINNFVVCNSETNLIEFEIDEKVMSKIIMIVDNSLN